MKRFKQLNHDWMVRTLKKLGWQSYNQNEQYTFLTWQNPYCNPCGVCLSIQRDSSQVKIEARNEQFPCLHYVWYESIHKTKDLHRLTQIAQYLHQRQSDPILLEKALDKTSSCDTI